MFKNTRLLACLFLAAGALLGWAAASADFGFLEKAKAAPITEAAAKTMLTSQTVETPACCSEGSIKGELLALAEPNAAVSLQAPLASQAAALAPTQADAVEAIVFQVLVPADAQLEIDQDKTQARGETREFQTPPLKVGGHYSYTLKATAQGKTVTRTVNLRHGSKQSFDLRGQFSTDERVVAPDQPDRTVLPPPGAVQGQD